MQKQTLEMKIFWKMLPIDFFSCVLFAFLFLFYFELSLDMYLYDIIKANINRQSFGGKKIKWAFCLKQEQNVQIEALNKQRVSK